MSINHLPCRCHLRRRRRCRPQHHLRHHPRQHCRHRPTTRPRQTHLMMNKSTVETVRAVLALVGATNWAASAFYVQVRDAPVQVAAVVESPSPLVVCVEALPTPRISRMERVAPPQCPSLLAPPLLSFNLPRADGTYCYKLHTRVAYIPTDYEASSHTHFVWSGTWLL